MIRKQVFLEENKWMYFFITLAVLVNFSGLFVILIDPDANVYAALSKNMVLQHNYIELYLRGTDWLDKPHFQFWVTAISFKIFGIHTWSYKLPAILFVLMGARYTYLFAKEQYDKEIALWAVFIFLTTEHIILSNNDVRAEPYLTGLIIASIYHFSNTIRSLFINKIWWHLIAACFFAACAVMTKGIFTLISIAGSVAGELLIKRNWKMLLNWRWFVSALLITLFITPELYSLWYQFDRHPEKIIFEISGVSGIRFFLWDSQFGRFLNTGPIKGRGDIFFFLHTLLWAFIPWSVIMYIALFNKIRSGLRNANTDVKPGEWYTLSGSILTLIVFSLSRFQLPYYTNIIFPFLAILSARYISEALKTTTAFLRILFNSITILLFAFCIAVQLFYEPAPPFWILLIIVGALIILLIGMPWLSNASSSKKINKNTIALLRAGLSTIILNLYLNWFFYPDLLQYQSGNEAAFYKNKNYPGVPGVVLNSYAPSFEFYLTDTFIKADSINSSNPLKTAAGIWYVSEEELLSINKSGRPYELLKEIPHFHVSILSWQFFNKKTRKDALQKYFLIRMM